MEEEQNKKTDEKISRKRRKLAIFRRQRKSSIRPFVKEKKHRQYKKIIAQLFLGILVLFLVVGLLYAIRTFVLPALFQKNTTMLNPQATQLPDNKQIQNMIQSKWIDTTNVDFASDSAVAVFTIRGRTNVIIATDKDVPTQLDLVEPIARQMESSGKQAISIDLRYNKPIVKF